MTSEDADAPAAVAASVMSNLTRAGRLDAVFEAYSEGRITAQQARRLLETPSIDDDLPTDPYEGRTPWPHPNESEES